MFDFLTLDLAIGVMGASALWAAGSFIYAKVKGGASLSSAVSDLALTTVTDAKAVEGKMVAIVQGTASAIATVRHETQVKLSAVETALHDRVVALEAFAFGPSYSAATEEAATTRLAPSIAAGTAPAPVAALPHASKVPTSHLMGQKLPTTPTAAAAVAGTAVSSLAAIVGTTK